MPYKKYIYYNITFQYVSSKIGYIYRFFTIKTIFYLNIFSGINIFINFQIILKFYFNRIHLSFDEFIRNFS